MLCVVLQNLTEFWNASTRPPTARDGFGLTTAEADRRVRIIERTTRFLPDTEAVRVHWRRLVVAHHVQGVQVHDARLVASMLAHGATHLLTLNTTDFRRQPRSWPLTPGKWGWPRLTAVGAHRGEAAVGGFSYNNRGRRTCWPVEETP